MAPKNDTVQDAQARTKLLKARTAMVMEHPFFASLALHLNLKEDCTCHTTWTDGETFGYNPNYVKILSHDKLIGVTAHTVMHPACSHHLRRGQRDADTWNKACDYVINPILIDAGLTLPDGFLLESAYEGKSAEQVYTTLKQGEKDKDQSKSDQENTADLNESSDQKQDKEEEQDQDETRADAQKNDPEPETPEPALAGEVRDGDTTPSPGAGDKLETDWEQALVQASANARAMGKLPKGIELFIQERFSPSLPWSELLARFIQQSARSDYTWLRPNRRYIHQDLYFPSLISDQLPEIAVVIDTSGSIQPDELDQFGVELSAILAMSPAQIHLLYTDMTVNRYELLSPWDLPFDFNPKGGGGTDFRAAFDFIDQNHIAPFCLIFFSDLECRLYPKQDPEFPILWIKTGEGGYHPPFGRVIELN